MTIQVETPDAPVTDEWLARQSFEAAFSQEQFEAAATKLDDPSERTPTRMAIALFLRSSDELMSSADDPAEACDCYMTAMDSFHARSESLKLEIEMLESASVRASILVAKNLAKCETAEERTQ